MTLSNIVEQLSQERDAVGKELADARSTVDELAALDRRLKSAIEKLTGPTDKKKVRATGVKAATNDLVRGLIKEAIGHSESGSVEVAKVWEFVQSTIAETPNMTSTGLVLRYSQSLESFDVKDGWVSLGIDTEQV